MLSDVSEHNPLVGNEGLPYFDRIKAEHVVPAISQVLKVLESDFTALEKNFQLHWQGLMQPLAAIGLKLHHSWSPVTHLNGVMNTPELRAAYEQVQGDIVSFSLRISQSQSLYQALKAMQTGKQWQMLSDVQRRIVEQKIQEAELSGIALQGEDKEEFNRLTHEAIQLSTTFANNVLDATKQFTLVLYSSEDTSGLPASFLCLAAQAYNLKFPAAEPQASIDKGPWLVTLDHPSFVPFMENSKRRDLREKLYKAFVTRAASAPYDNRPLIKRLLQIRKRQAQLLGFRTYAELSISRKMAPSVAAIYQLEEELLRAAWHPACQELAELQAIAANHGFAGELAQWDIAYWAKRLQEEKFQFSDEDLRPYFALPQVLEGLFQLVHKLFNITVKKANDAVAVWHKDVQFFHIYDEQGSHLASFYLDPYSRPENKRGGAWMDECLTRFRQGDKLVKPVAYLVCNATPPLHDTPALMTFREVETLFHEFGHGLQHMLTTVEHIEVSGINGIEWDAIELPSQFMENWCYHQPTLKSIARHYQTAEAMPDALFEKLLAAKTFRAGQMMLRQIQFGLLDLDLHDRYDPTGDESPFDVQRQIAAKTSVLPPLADDYFLCSFTHIFSGGYAAGYYSYKWAEVLSADVFAAFEEVQDDEVALAKVGAAFRQTVLALGGSSHPLNVFRSFRGRDPNPKALLRHNGLLTEPA